MLSTVNYFKLGLTVDDFYARLLLAKSDSNFMCHRPEMRSDIVHLCASAPLSFDSSSSLLLSLSRNDCHNTVNEVASAPF